MDRKSTKVTIHKALKNVPNYVTKIEAELLNKKDLSFSTGWISQCLNPNSAKWNLEIIEAALALIEAEREKEIAVHEKVSGL